jgi:type IV pilus assembly protein PilQ
MRTHQENVTMFHWRSRSPPCRVGRLPCCAPAPAAWAQNAIQSITSTQQAGTEVVRIELSEPLAAVPNGFSVQSPPRIAIDLPGVGNAIGRNWSRSTRATCARSTWRRPASARAWCST